SVHSSLLPDHRHLPSFPTRRSSDLTWVDLRSGCACDAADPTHQAVLLLFVPALQKTSTYRPAISSAERPINAARARSTRARAPRSEEHTSELQSRVDLVCRLLLEKK